MKLKLLIIALVFVFLNFTSPAIAQITPLSNTRSGTHQEKPQPLKTYFLNLLPEGARQSIKLEPPATQLVVSSESGDTAVRCGDGFHTYSCTPGNSIEVTADTGIPIAKFWAENPTHKRLRLRIDVYAISDTQLEANRSAQRVVSGKRYLGVQRKT